jgi:hypothetical protein
MTEAEKMAARVKTTQEPEEEKKAHTSAERENLINFDEEPQVKTVPK